MIEHLSSNHNEHWSFIHVVIKNGQFLIGSMRFFTPFPRGL